MLRPFDVRDPYGIYEISWATKHATAIDSWIPLSDNHPRPLNGALVRIKPGLSAREAQASWVFSARTLPRALRRISASSALNLNATPFTLGEGASSILFASLLEEIEAYEPLAYFVAICAVFAAAMAAAYVPSMRAARVDPASALRHE